MDHVDRGRDFPERDKRENESLADLLHVGFKDESPAVRLEATQVSGLSGAIEHKSIPPELIRMALNDKSEKVRRSAIVALATAYSSTPNLLATMLTILEKEESQEVKARK